MSAPRDIKLTSVRKPKTDTRRLRVRRSPLPWPIEMVPLGHLRSAARNPRTHPKKQIEQLVKNIQHFGYTSPAIVDEKLNIIAGHARAEAAQSAGLSAIPVIVMTGLSEAEKRALALADNKISERGGWLRSDLALELSELAPLLEKVGLDFGLTAFEPAEFDALKVDLVDSEEDPSDELPTILARAPVSRPGDLWLLGQQRILCGDTTKQEDMQELMGCERAVMVFADPPYNRKIKSIQGRGKTKHREFAQASGEMSDQGFTEFLMTCLSLAAKYSIDGAVHFVCMDWRHGRALQTAGEKVYTALKNICVWVKTNAGMGSFYRSKHEFVYVFKCGDAPHINNFELGQHGRNRSNVWTYAGVNTFKAGRMDESSMHPTVKPIALVADAIRDCSRRGDIVLDPFLGSGTTIMASERIGRRAYGIEIDPLYVDAAVQRWQHFTKRDAILKRTGQTFDEVAAVRTSTPTWRAK